MEIPKRSNGKGDQCARAAKAGPGWNVVRGLPSGVWCDWNGLGETVIVQIEGEKRRLSGEAGVWCRVVLGTGGG